MPYCVEHQWPDSAEATTAPEPTDSPIDEEGEGEGEESKEGGGRGMPAISEFEEDGLIAGLATGGEGGEGSEGGDDAFSEAFSGTVDEGEKGDRGRKDPVDKDDRRVPSNDTRVVPPPPGMKAATNTATATDTTTDTRVTTVDTSGDGSGGGGGSEKSRTSGRAETAGSVVGPDTEGVGCAREQLEQGEISKDEYRVICAAEEKRQGIEKVIAAEDRQRSTDSSSRQSSTSSSLSNSRPGSSRAPPKGHKKAGSLKTALSSMSLLGGSSRAKSSDRELRRIADEQRAANDAVLLRRCVSE